MNIFITHFLIFRLISCKPLGCEVLEDNLGLTWVQLGMRTGDGIQQYFKINSTKIEMIILILFYYMFLDIS